MLRKFTIACLGLLTASMAAAFDAGTSDPDGREYKDLPGANSCRMNATFLARSNNLTEITLSVPGTGYHYGNLYYRSASNTWSASESDYYVVNPPDSRLKGDFLSASDATLATQCGWDSASITDLTPSSTFKNGSFDNADSASVQIDYVYLARNYRLTATLDGAANTIATAKVILLGTSAAPTGLSLVSAGSNTLRVSFTPPVNGLGTTGDEVANAITDYEYELNGSGNWVSTGSTNSPIDLNGLNSGANYSIKLRAVNGVGNGVASSALSASTLNTTPVSNAGPDQSVAAGTTVTLDGSASSDADGNSLAYSWTQSSGPTVTLSNSTLAQPTFTAPSLGYNDANVTLLFSLSVSDGTATSSADTVEILIIAPVNSVPIANAGPDQEVNSGSTVTLDGSASSDSDGHNLTYTWTQVSGPTVKLSNHSSVKPTFVAPLIHPTEEVGVIRFNLEVSDGIDVSSADSVTITVLQVTPEQAFDFVKEDVEVELAEHTKQQIYNTVSFNELALEFDRFHLSAKDQKTEVGSNSFIAAADNKNVNLHFRLIDPSIRSVFLPSILLNYENSRNGTTDNLSSLKALFHWRVQGETNENFGLFLGYGEASSRNVDQNDLSGTISYKTLHYGAVLNRSIQSGLNFKGYVSNTRNLNDVKFSTNYVDANSEYHQDLFSAGINLGGQFLKPKVELEPQIEISYVKAPSTIAEFQLLTARASSRSSIATKGAELYELKAKLPLKYKLYEADGKHFVQTYLKVRPEVFCQTLKLNTKTSKCGTKFFSAIETKMTERDVLGIELFAQNLDGQKTDGLSVFFKKLF